MADGTLPPWLTQDWLAKATLEQRGQVWRNACERGGPEGEAVAAFIKASGLSYTPRGYLTEDDPRVIRMTDMINTPESRQLMEAATAEGLPALAGIDARLKAALGADYCGGNGMTQTAGDRVAKVMRSNGYVDTVKRDMPPGSVAKTAQAFKRKG